MKLRSNLIVFGLMTNLFSSLVFAGGQQYAGRYVKGDGKYKINGKNNETFHSIELYGNGKGKYCINNNSCGELYDIIIDGPDTDIVGKWVFGGMRGTFSWSTNGDGSFNGGFRFNQFMRPSDDGSIYQPYDGEWNGQLN